MKWPGVKKKVPSYMPANRYLLAPFHSIKHPSKQTNDIRPTFFVFGLLLLSASQARWRRCTPPTLVCASSARTSLCFSFAGPPTPLARSSKGFELPPPSVYSCCSALAVKPLAAPHHCAHFLTPLPIQLQLFAHVGAKDASELRLASTELSTVFADEAMVSDFALADDSVIHAVVGSEEVPKGH